jgi:glutathione S-transferase
MSESKPVLWQIDVSHYSEKARWALAHKGIEHVRRSPMPGSHIPIALWLTRGGQITFPILQLDGRTIGDSTAIIAALEEHRPQPPLYPADPEQRRRALELEDHFDRELGPHIRLLAWHELINEPDLMDELAARSAPGPLAKAKRAAGAYARTFTRLRFGAGSEKAADLARDKVTAAMDRLDLELAAGGGEYLVGDEFSVADLTAASLFYPLVRPAEGPMPADLPSPAAFERFQATLRDRPGFAYVEEMFRRHRKPGRAAGSSATV